MTQADALELGARIPALRALLEAADYRGNDPFDLVNAPIFARLPSRGPAALVISKFGSRVAPDVLRRMLRVAPVEDPKTYCCAYWGWLALGERTRAEEMLDRLAAIAQRAPEGAYWGYDFLWPTRSGDVNPRRASALVPAAFTMLTLVDGIVALDHDRHRGLLRDAVGYYTTRHRSSAGPYLGYFPSSRSNTHNANLLGCAALSLSALVLADDQPARIAAEAAEATVAAVGRDGYLPYGDYPAADWTDCFHHIYVIAALSAVARTNPFVDREMCDAAIERLTRYWFGHFLRDDGLLNYYPDRLYPIDPHNYAVTAIYFTLFGDESQRRMAVTLLRRVDALTWDGERGRYAHRVHRRRRDRRMFLRWTQAWMFAALATVTSDGPLAEHASRYGALVPRCP
jgi:hypothetical protein